jgi:hypothetical protein
MPLQRKSLGGRRSVGVLLTTDAVSAVATISAAPPRNGGRCDDSTERPGGRRTLNGGRFAETLPQ